MFTENEIPYTHKGKKCKYVIAWDTFKLWIVYKVFLHVWMFAYVFEEWQVNP